MCRLPEFTRDYEMSVLSRALQQDLCKADEEIANQMTQLLGSSAPRVNLAAEIGCRSVMVAQRFRYRNTMLKVDDVVICCYHRRPSEVNSWLFDGLDLKHVSSFFFNLVSS